MNPKIENMLKEIVRLEDEFDECLKEDYVFTAIKIKERIDSYKEYIKGMRYHLHNTIPEPWASMKAEDIINSLGVYK